MNLWYNHTPWHPNPSTHSDAWSITLASTVKCTLIKNLALNFYKFLKLIQFSLAIAFFKILVGTFAKYTPFVIKDFILLSKQSRYYICFGPVDRCSAWEWNWVGACAPFEPYVDQPMHHPSLYL